MQGRKRLAVILSVTIAFMSIPPQGTGIAFAAETTGEPEAAGTENAAGGPEAAGTENAAGADTVSGNYVEKAAYAPVPDWLAGITGDGYGAFDFSEHNIMTNCSYDDPDGFDRSKTAGGNTLQAAAYFARWDGTVEETADPYPAGNSGLNYRELEASGHVQDIIFLPDREDKQDNGRIKEAVMDYGAVTASFILAQNTCFDAALQNYYMPEDYDDAGDRSAGGHSVVIVGWDDNYPAGSFSFTPPGDGAFLCKNSWGDEEAGYRGYFYLSYYDKYIGNRNICMAFDRVQSAANYDRIYQYDPFGPVSTYSNGAGEVSMANVFPEEGKGVETEEALAAVSFYTTKPDTSFEIYVVEDYVSKESLETSGLPVKAGRMDDAGYHTVELDDPVAIAVGSRFAVIVHIKSDSGISYYVESRVRGYSGRARANAGEGYVKTSGEWQDVTDIQTNASLCVKAFSNVTGADIPEETEGVDNGNRLYESESSYSVDRLLQEGAQLNPEFVEYIQGGSQEEGDVPVPVTVEPAGGESGRMGSDRALSYPAAYNLVTEGRTTPVRDQGAINACWAFAALGSLESGSLRFVPLDHIALAHTGADIRTGETYFIEAACYPENRTDSGRLEWTSSDETVATVQNGQVYGVSAGEAVIRAAAENGVSASCLVTVEGEAAALEELRMNPETLVLEQEGEAVLDVSFLPENTTAQRSVRWKSGNPLVASVVGGRVKAGVAGETVITAESGGKTAACLVTVNPPGKELLGIRLDRQEMPLETGEEKLLTVEYEPGDTTDDRTPVWNSSDPAIASVEEGMVTAKGIGRAQITAKVGGYSAECSVTVSRKQVHTGMPFTDVPGGGSDWKYQAAEYAYEYGIMEGKGGGRFAPADALTRAELAQIFYCMADSPPADGSSGFSDVEAGKWYGSAVVWAGTEGIAYGYPDGSFGVNDPVTREQMVVMLYRFAQTRHYRTEERASTVGFSDAGRVSGFAGEAVQWAVAEGVLTGKPNRFNGCKLDPQGEATRAEGATVVMRLLESCRKQ